MTDYRRPDLDMWEEEDDAEDARPTIVSERPSPGRAPEGVLGQTLVGVKAPSLIQPRTRSAEPQNDQGRMTPEVGRAALVKRLIEQGALEDDLLPRDSAENLGDSDIAALRISGPGSARPPSLPAVALSAAEDDGSEPAHVADAEAEEVGEEHVPTVAVKRPLAMPPPALLNTVLPRPMPLPARDRDVTERISLESPLQSSLAPTAHTLRPGERTQQKGFAWWQTALAALALIGGGLGVQQLRRINRESEQVSAAASQTESRPAAVSSERALPEALPTPAAVEPPAAPAPAAPAPAPAAPAPTPEPVAALPVAKPAAQKPVLAPRKPRAVQPAQPAPESATETSEPSVETEPAVAVSPTPGVAKPGVAKPEESQDLPSQPSREQVTAALNAVVPELEKCVGDRHGTADLTLTVRSVGVVSYAVVGGMYAGTPEGSCLARAVKGAKFPAFRDPVLRVTYPFQL